MTSEFANVICYINILILYEDYTNILDFTANDSQGF